MRIETITQLLNEIMKKEYKIFNGTITVYKYGKNSKEYKIIDNMIVCMDPTITFKGYLYDEEKLINKLRNCKNNEYISVIMEDSDESKYDEYIKYLHNENTAESEKLIKILDDAHTYLMQELASI